jgi:hypothetical protein
VVYYFNSIHSRFNNFPKISCILLPISHICS